MYRFLYRYCASDSKSTLKKKMVRIMRLRSMFVPAEGTNKSHEGMYKIKP